MCGITAILGNCQPNIIIDSLKQLQNRGYDSAGISILNNEVSNFDIFKELYQESIENLKIKLNNKYSNENKFYNIISHTRWATHGGITLNNCHPHLSNNGEICLVHNGIIENYKQIKTFLIKNNYKFYSETDSEVIVNLIEYYLNKYNNIQESILLALKQCNGTWGLAIQYIKEPNIIYAIKKGSPLLLGKTEELSILTSETSGFNNLIYNYHELLSDKLYIIDNLNNIIFNYDNNIKYDLNNIDNVESFLGNYDHYTIKEIYEQKDIINKITNNGARIKNNNIILGGLIDYKEKILNCDNLILFGCGTSYHFKKLCEFKNVISIDACNFQDYLIPKGNNCFFFISQSGETKDLYSVLKIIKENKSLYGITVGIINVVNSLISRTVDCGVYLNIGKEMSVASTKVFMAQSLVLVLISIYLSKNNIEKKKYIDDICNLTELISIELNKKIEIENFNNGFLLANNNLLPIAMEASLKFKEITYSHIEALSINSLKHGPLALVSEVDFVNIILGNHESATQEILARNGKIINISIYYKNIFNDLLYIIHLQKYNYQLSILKGINPDFPRNLAKVVTV